MGLSLVVGVIPALYAGADEAERQHCRDELAALSGVLRALGLPEHREPERPAEGAPWRCEIGRPVCIHFLRRIAAHRALERDLPAPPAGNPARDPIIQEYYARCETVRPQLAPAESAQLALSLDVAQPEVAVIRGPGFEHLMWHSDCTGFYLPVPFPEVIVLPNGPQWGWHEWGPWLGSAPVLLQECERLADALGYPRSMSVEELRQQKPDETASGWQRYAIESFTCQALIAGCEASLRSGCALVFC